MIRLKIIFAALLLFLISCNSDSNSGGGVNPVYSLTLDFTRIEQPGLDPFEVTATLHKDGASLAGQALALDVPGGTVSPVADNGDGTYTFTVTPTGTGVYPVAVSYRTASVSRSALVLDTVGAAGQPLAVPGNFVNTEGYEDGITITPDGQYLFVQYGPVYFSGVLNVSSICSSASYSLYDLNGCAGRPNSEWIFNTIGPYGDSTRPGFPDSRISLGVISHLTSVTVPNVVNGVAAFPTVFYGFRRQPDGTFAEPFKLAFDDQDKGVQGPFGLSFQMTGPGTANFVVAWDNYLNHLGDDGPDVYTGTITMGQDTSLGTVTYDSNGIISSATPSVAPVSFPTHTSPEGNPHLYYDETGVVKSIWTDDESVTKDLAVYTLVSGTYPGGTWSPVTLPAKINTSAEESQPFFNGARLYLRRGNKIVYHAYTGSGGTDFDQDASWGDEVVVLESALNTTVGSIITVGEPTIAVVNGKTYLYFVYGIVRAAGLNGLLDINMDAGFVELL